MKLESPFQSEDESTEPLTSPSTSATSNGSGVHADVLEDFTVPVYPLLEDIHVEEDNSLPPDSSAFKDDKLYPGAPISNLYAVSLLFFMVWCLSRSEQTIIPSLNYPT